MLLLNCHLPLPLSLSHFCLKLYFWNSVLPFIGLREPWPNLIKQHWQLKMTLTERANQQESKIPNLCQEVASDTWSLKMENSEAWYYFRFQQVGRECPSNGAEVTTESKGLNWHDQTWPAYTVGPISERGSHSNFYPTTPSLWLSVLSCKLVFLLSFSIFLVSVKWFKTCWDHFPTGKNKTAVLSAYGGPLHARHWSWWHYEAC